MSDIHTPIHLGQIIENILREKGLSKKILAERLDIKNQNINKQVFDNYALKTDLIQRINAALDCNLFEYFIDTADRSMTLPDGDRTQLADTNHNPDVNEIVNLKKQIELLEARLKDKEEMIELLKKSLDTKD